MSVTQYKINEINVHPHPSGKSFVLHCKNNRLTYRIWIGRNHRVSAEADLLETLRDGRQIRVRHERRVRSEIEQLKRHVCDNVTAAHVVVSARDGLHKLKNRKKNLC